MRPGAGHARKTIEKWTRPELQRDPVADPQLLVTSCLSSHAWAVLTRIQLREQECVLMRVATTGKSRNLQIVQYVV